MTTDISNPDNDKCYKRNACKEVFFMHRRYWFSSSEAKYHIGKVCRWLDALTQVSNFVVQMILIVKSLWYDMDIFLFNKLKDLPAHPPTGATLFQKQIGRVLQGKIGGKGMCKPLPAHTSGNKERKSGKLETMFSNTETVCMNKGHVHLYIHWIAGKLY